MRLTSVNVIDDSRSSSSVSTRESDQRAGARSCSRTSDCNHTLDLVDEDIYDKFHFEVGYKTDRIGLRDIRTQNVTRFWGPNVKQKYERHTRAYISWRTRY